jgi:peptide/nickel transport system substrate-binding protein
MSATSKKNTNYIIAAILIVIILAGVGYYFYNQSAMAPTGGTSSTMMSSTGVPISTIGPQTTVAAGKDTIVVGTTDSVQSSIDPADAYDYFGINIIQNVGAGLVDYRPGTTTIVPALATDWKVSSDGLTWTFNLRQGVKFPDGTPLDASVVKYTMDREFKIDEPVGPFAGVGYDTIINKTVVTGQYQVQFVLNFPFSPFLAVVAFTPMYPVNPKVATMSAIVNYTGTPATENPTGLGPYLLKNWVRTAGKDVEIDLTANPNYWNATSGYPRTKNINIKFYTDSTSLNLAMQSGAVDIAYRQLAPADIKSYQSNTNVKVWQGPGQFIQYLVFNEKQAPFDKVAVRQAIAAATDRSLITDTVFLGQSVPLYSMVPIGMAYHTDSFKSAYGDANIAKAQSLLASAGFTASNPLKFTLTYPTGHYQSTDGISSALKQALEKTGVIQVTLASQPWPNYKASTGADQLQAYLYGWYPDYVDPYDYTYPFLPPDGIGFLHSHYVSATMAQLLQTAASTTDPSTFPTTYGKIQDLIATDVPMVPLFQGTSIAVSNLKVGGIVLDPTTIFRYYLLTETA